MQLSDDLEYAFKLTEAKDKAPSSPSKRSRSLQRQASSNVSSPAARRGRSLERQPSNLTSPKANSAISKRNELRQAKRSSSLSAAPANKKSPVDFLSRKQSSGSFSESVGGRSPKGRSTGNILTYDIWLAASQASKGLPPPINGMSAEQNLDVRKMLSVKAELRAKKNWLIALRTIVAARHWAGVAGYDWKYDTTPVEKLPGFKPFKTPPHTPRGDASLTRGAASGSGSGFGKNGSSGVSPNNVMSPRSLARIGTQF